MNRAELMSIVRCRLEAEPDVPGGQILAELLESIGRIPGEELRLKKMTCDAIVSTYLSISATRPTRTVVHQRKRIKKFTTIESVLERLETADKVLAIVGAGASTSAGLPDFRSEGGLYDQIRADYGEQFDDPQLLFDETQFKLDPRPFFRVANKLLTASPGAEVKPTRCHTFLAKLEEAGKLLRCYTQNVDGLEVRAGVTRVVHCHGNLATSTCMTCGARYPTKIESMDHIPQCKNDSGILRPDIVFFGQDLPQEYKTNVERDVRDADLVLIFGSSLKVHPVASLVTRFHHRVPMVLINREVVGKPNEFDVELLGDCDAIVEHLEAELGGGESDSEDDEEDLRRENALALSRSASPAAQPFVHIPPNTYLFANARMDEAEKQRRLEAVTDKSGRATAQIKKPKRTNVPDV